LRESIQCPWLPGDLPFYERGMAFARDGLGEQEFARAWAEGRAMTPEEAIALALAEMATM
jgi:hypothetical protein